MGAPGESVFPSPSSLDRNITVEESSLLAPRGPSVLILVQISSTGEEKELDMIKSMSLNGAHRACGVAQAFGN